MLQLWGQAKATSSVFPPILKLQIKVVPHVISSVGSGQKRNMQTSTCFAVALLCWLTLPEYVNPNLTIVLKMPFAPLKSNCFY